MLCHHFAKFGSHRYCTSGDIMSRDQARPRD